MRKKSGIYKYNGKRFRYDYEHAIVEYVAKATAQEKKDNEEWIAKFGKPLWDIDEGGYLLIDSIGLSRENWKDKEARNGYLEEYCYQLEDSVASELAGMF